MVMRNEQRPDDGLRNCDARQDPIQRVPEVAGLRSDPRCHGNRRQHGDLPALSVAISWSLITLSRAAVTGAHSFK